MEEKREGFEFVDKRRVKADAPEAETPEAEPLKAEEPIAQPEEDAAQAGQAEEGAETGIPNVDVYGLLSSMLGILHSMAWQKMGILANPATGKIETDMEQAKVAIDTLQFVAGKVEAKLSEAEVRELRRLMMDLQMNYVQRSGSES